MAWGKRCISILYFSRLTHKRTITRSYLHSSEMHIDKPVHSHMSSVVKNGLPPRPPAALPVRYATAVSGASAPSTSTPTSTSVSASISNGSAPIGTTASTTHSSVHDVASSSPSLTQASASGPSPLLSSASASGIAADESSHSQVQSPEISEAVPPSNTVPQQTTIPSGIPLAIFFKYLTLIHTYL